MVPSWQLWRQKLHEVIFGSDTPAGKAFDVLLIISILLSVAVVMLESMVAVRADYGQQLRAAEWGFTILFTVEYVLRIISSFHRIRYITGFFGVVDLFSIVPTYLSVLIPGTQYFMVIRVLRILRIFRVLKLSRYLQEAGTLTAALKASRRKIEVFLAAVLTMVTVFGSMMYFIEGAANGFTSIPRSIYWAIVTLTTVGYGDISPQTGIGQVVAALIMILGYGIIAVPTGIVTTELARADNSWKAEEGRAVALAPCPSCGRAGHDNDAEFCKYCGGSLSGVVRNELLPEGQIESKSTRSSNDR